MLHPSKRSPFEYAVRTQVHSSAYLSDRGKRMVLPLVQGWFAVLSAHGAMHYIRRLPSAWHLAVYRRVIRMASLRSSCRFWCDSIKMLHDLLHISRIATVHNCAQEECVWHPCSSALIAQRCRSAVVYVPEHT